ncbi:MAG: reverse transcriptase-like protein [Actinomycetota bacterium]|nr:reverse transcriptase-like protein [Actinomycetota bacterium]
MKTVKAFIDSSTKNGESGLAASLHWSDNNAPPFASVAKRVACVKSADADYHAVILALNECLKLRPPLVVHVYTDSECVFRNCRGAKPKGKERRELMRRIRGKVLALQERGCVVKFFQVPRSFVSLPDGLARRQVEERSKAC